jgi:hypothetical protein
MDLVVEQVVQLASYVVLIGLPLIYCAGWGIRHLTGLYERRATRQLFERLALARLKTVETAAAMGLDRAGLLELDRRLEQAIGSEQLRELLAAQAPEGRADTTPAGLVRLARDLPQQ